MIFTLITIIDAIARILILLVIVDAVLSYFMSPYSQIRMVLNRIIGPLLAPIRRIIPPIGGTIDISPIVLIILIQLLDTLLSSILIGLK